MADTDFHLKRNNIPEERKRYLPIPYEELGQLGKESPIPSCLQQMRIFEFDTAEYPFREAMAEILDVSPDCLESLHQTDEGRRALEEEMSGSQHRKRGRQPYYVRRWTHAGQTGERRRFDDILQRFMEEFVAYRMSGTEDGDYGEKQAVIAFQREPTFRVVLPSGQQLGYRHCDADYHHPPAEINWWLPLTCVSDSNSLHTESLPGAGDFSPVSLRYGQVLRFYGNLCCHFTVPNVSSVTRVSFDTRVLAMAHHNTGWTDRLGRPCLFKVGQYYKVPSQARNTNSITPST